MEFRNLDYVSPQLNTAIQSYIERMDMDGRDRELFYDIIHFAYLEGKIQGSENVINGVETKEHNNE